MSVRQAGVALNQSQRAVASELQDLGRLSPGSLVVCEPCKGTSPPAKDRPIPRPPSSADAGVRQLQTELIQLVAGAGAGV